MSRMSVIGDLIAQNKWTCGVELGVYQGDTFGYLLDRFPDLVLYGFDHWRPRRGIRQDKETGETSNTEVEMSAARFKAFGIAKEFPERAHLIDRSSQDGVNFLDGTVDFVFIDADHTTAAVAMDIGIWQPVIRPGGALIGHDYNWPSVRRAVDSMLGDVASLPSNLWIWRYGNENRG